MNGKAMVCAMAGIIFTSIAGNAGEAASALSPREKNIVRSAAFAAKGDQSGLKKALASGLDAGVTVNEYKEILVQVYAYCGFPRSLNALNTFKNLLDERGNRDAAGKLPDPLPAGKNIDFGTANQTKLCGAPVKGALFEFAPAIDEYLKAHLFGDIFARNNVDWKTRELATVAMLAAIGNVETQLNAHIGIAKHNGATDAQIAEILVLVRNEVLKPAVFPVGSPNTAYAKFFQGDSYLAALTSNKEGPLNIANVTFEPACRNNWHIHRDSVQVLIGLEGCGWYQAWGQPAVEIKPGTTIQIPAGVKHWHGAGPDGWFQHIAFSVKTGDSPANEWLEAVSDADYAAATAGK